MYPLTHLYVTQQVLGYLNKASALGSILPDILTGAGQKWQQAHNFKVLDGLEPDIIRGDLIHGSYLPGLDYYSDCAYMGREGFAFQHAVYLRQELLELELPKEHILWRGHNFIEMAVEINLNKIHNHLWSYLEEASTDLALKKQIYQVMVYYNLDNPNSLDSTLTRFLSIRGQEELLAEDYAQKLNKIYQLNLTAENCLQIIGKSQEIVAEHYQNFLNYCIQQISQDLKAVENRLIAAKPSQL